MLIDGTHQAKRLDATTVLVARSSPRAWATPLACDGRAVRVDLRDPSKAAVAAVAEAVGGALAARLGYNPALGRVENDWFWSVGANAFSDTSGGAAVTATQAEWVWRGYVVAAVDAAAARVNRGVAALAAKAVDAATEDFFAEGGGELRRRRDAVLAGWRVATGAAGRLDFVAAVEAAEAAAREAAAFEAAARAFADATGPRRCRRRRRVRGAAAHLALALASVLAWAARRRALATRAKPKVN